MHNITFFPWLLYNWKPKQWQDKFNPAQDWYATVPSTIAELYVEKNKLRLTDTEKKYIQINCSNIFSFHEVLDCQPGKGYLLRDILLGTELYVYEQSGSQQTRPGDVIFAKVIQYDELGLLSGSGAVLITPAYKIQIIDLRETIKQDENGKISLEILDTWEFEIRSLYFDICTQIMTPPDIRNTDGNELSLNTLQYKITSAQLAFDKLKKLASPALSEEEMLQDAEFDADNNLSKIVFPWIKKQKTGPRKGELISLGEGNKLSVFVNSEERIKKIRAEIKKRLGEDAVFSGLQVKSIDEALEERKESRIQKIPEIELPIAGMQEILDQHLKYYWEKWLDLEIPALNGETPLNAVKTKNGREKVKALLNDMERRQQTQPEGDNQLKYIQRTRKQLGLTK